MPHLLRQLIATITLPIIFCTPSQAQQPNIIYIMTDDMGYADLSSYGRKEYTTPNIDKLAAQGIRFINAYAAAAVCTPTRTAFMTGRYPARTPVGLMEPLIRGKMDSIGLTADYPSIGTLLRKAGYETALIGKWHLGFIPLCSPNQNGFDYFFGIHSGAADYISHKNDIRIHDLYENDKPVYPKGYLTDLIADKAISFLNRPHKKPFFLSIQFNAPHWPWQGPGAGAVPDSVNYRSGGSPVVFAEMMKSLDNAIGNIMSTLDKSPFRNTIVIFTNDNGGERYSDNGGLAYSKSYLWEGGIKVPAFVRWTGKIKPGSVTSQVAVTMDWTATILAAADAKPHSSFPLDAIDLMPVMQAKTQKNIERTLYWRSFQHRRQKAIRSGDWKYIQDEKGEFLFNIATDMYEKNNLKDAHQDVFNKLKEQLANWETTVLKPIPF
jgi:arylsulfatase A-like enzyme